jgi:hypothetical protein
MRSLELLECTLCTHSWCSLALLSLTCFLKTTMYELGTSLACVDDRIGAASLWMVPTCSMGDAAASTGMNVKAYLMMAVGSHSED